MKIHARLAAVLAAATTVVLGLLVAPGPLPAAAGAAPRSTSSSDDCGVLIAKPGGGNWSCTFHDEFDGSALDRTKWVPQTNFVNGSPTRYACYVDDPAVVSVSGGSLRLSVKDAGVPVTCPAGLSSTYAAGQVSTFYKFSQQYGRFEARMKVPAATQPGLQEAFWLWPDVRYHDTSTWPLSGEIDIVETYSQHPTLAIPFLHYSADSGGPQPGLNTAWNCAASRGVWNTYTLEWSANRIEISVNGVSCLVNTSGDAAFQKRYIIALTQALGRGGNAWDGSGALLPATTEVDYVRVWE
ncbi:family 16 glycosylhydrolase [Nocardioides sp. SLBN-35]|uniref:glycoside hydrolase family 16 protein n=1 Tax=Nocardioides sp. SLBN-35 TaxID=2768445 RepID=UPI00114DB20C|nr:glycoside hydrolase family 16 protein [Nocardioides sp. SLBN-35]TQK68672.1 beta-glucanase (GH16 family) [Nocardioides sp. SLBN-35]